MIKTLQENNVLFSTLWTNIQYYCICGPSCPLWAELYGFPRRLPRLPLDREFDARLDWMVANYCRIIYFRGFKISWILDK